MSNSWLRGAFVLVLVLGLAAGSILAAAPRASTSTVLWRTNFSGSDPRADLRMEVEESRANLSFPSPAHRLDAKVYRARMVAGQRNGHKWRARFHNAAGANGTHLGIGARNEVYFSYRVWIPSNASVDSIDLKLPGIAGLPDRDGGWATATGGDQRSDSWSLRLHVRHPRASYYGQPRPQRFVEAYLYAQEGGGKSIADHSWGMSYTLTDTTRESGKSLALPLDRWNHVEMRVRMNSRGQADGRVEVWLNGVKGVSLRDVRFTLTDGVPINQLIAETFYNSGARNDHSIDLARMRLSTGRLGP
jgi:hypothetical protein